MHFTCILLNNIGWAISSGEGREGGGERKINAAIQEETLLENF